MTDKKLQYISIEDLKKVLNSLYDSHKRESAENPDLTIGYCQALRDVETTIAIYLMDSLDVLCCDIREKMSK